MLATKCYLLRVTWFDKTMQKVNVINRCNSFSIAFAIAFTICAFCSSEEIDVNLANHDVSKPGNLITIGDIADVSNKSSRIARKIASLDLAEFGFDNDEVEVSIDQVRMRIIVAGIDSSKFRLRGVDALVVRRTVPTEARPLIEAKVLDEMKTQFSVDKNDIGLALLPAKNQKLLTQLASHLDQSTVIFPTELPAGNAIFKFLFHGDDGKPQSLDLPFQISIQHNLVVATRSIRRGAFITKDAIKQVRRPLQTAEFVSLRPEECVGMIATKDIGAHSIILATHVASNREKIRLNRNDRVDIVSRRFGSQFRIPNAKVLSSAAEGEAVSVANPDTNKVVRAVVIDNSTVELK